MSESFSKNDDPFRCGVSDSGSVDHSSGDHSERGVGGRGSEIDAKRIRDLAQGEITGLFTWRLIVVAVILVTYASVTAASYMFLNNLLLFDDKESVRIRFHLGY